MTANVGREAARTSSSIRLPTRAAPGVPGAYTPPAAAPMAAPVPPAAPPAAPVDPLGAPAGYRMVNPQGANYATYRNGGWTDAQLLQHGHMVKL